MCGIAGYFSLNREKIDTKRFEFLLDTIKHRGPDDFGYAVFNSDLRKSRFVEDPNSLNGIDFTPDLIFGHRRLSIIDLSPSGRQPMTDEKGNFWIVFNGEIYNYIELREELKSFGFNFRTHSDTEVILKAYEHWGEGCLNKFNGMFSFALWDVKEKRLFCARDRMGVKPFYYYVDKDRFVFASEIKAFLEVDIERNANEQIVYDYLSQGLIDHTDDTFFYGIKQLSPAHYLVLSEGKVDIRRWWDIEDNKLTDLSDDEYARRFYELFEDSIRLRLRSDVPIGTCLSGGLDSSSIVCIANKLMFQGDYHREIVGDRQRTFSSCFEDRKYDERVFIEEVIQKTNARSYYIFPEGKELFDLIPKVIWHQDEPFGSTSIFAQWHVMKLARENGVKVLLDGQGADELLAGYHGYFGTYYVDLARSLHILRLFAELYFYKKIHKKFQPMIFASVARAILPDSLIAVLRKMPAIRNASKQATIGNVWIDRDFEKVYRREYTFKEKFKSSLKNQLYSLFMYSSLPALLHYEDRNSMAFSIEARVPFLDYRLVEYIFSLPSEQKIRSAMTKVALRNAMKGILPEKVRTRVDKMGFVTPENIWFRSILKDKIIDIIESNEFKNIGYFNVPEVKKKFESHCRGEKDIGFTIWRWINLFLWYEMFIKGKI
jgi:asparagine synthase (glutamine-hydrolysing)